MLRRSVLISFGILHEFWGELTMSTKVSLHFKTYSKCVYGKSLPFAQVTRTLDSCVGNLVSRCSERTRHFRSLSSPILNDSEPFYSLVDVIKSLQHPMPTMLSGRTGILSVVPASWKFSNIINSLWGQSSRELRGKQVLSQVMTCTEWQSTGKHELTPE